MAEKKILLAEDDEMLASLLKFRLEKGGYAVSHARDGRQVKEYLESQKADIIISDTMMPYFSGIELVEFLRNELEDSTPVIIMSTAGNESNVLNAFEMGADDFVSKPVSPSELLVRVGKLLRQRAY